MSNLVKIDVTNKQIASYLRTRPIAPIFKRSNEKGNAIALKIMCILDKETERSQLYDRIQKTKSDTLMMQLMQFHTFQSFRFYDYNVKREIKQYALRCTACGLIGPYACILTHMAINHDLHIGLKMCVYCDRAELQKHFDNNSLERCYRNYLRERNINECDTVEGKIVSEFYDMLRKICEKLSIVTVRNHSYAAKRTWKRVKSVCMNTNVSAIDDEFNQIMSVISARGDLLELPRNDESDSAVGAVDEPKYSFEMSDEIENGSDDDIMIVDIVKNEPPLDIQASPNEPLISGLHYRRHSRDSVETGSVSTAHLMKPANPFERNDAERFGLFVAQSLEKLPTEIQRRKLEIQIETAILNAKKAAFQ